MCWVYLLKEKSQIFDMFKKFHLLITNEAQLNIGTIRTNNGGEYTYTPLKNICKRMESNTRPQYHIIHRNMVLQNE